MTKTNHPVTSGLLRDSECEVLHIFRSYGVREPERLVRSNHANGILQIDAQWYHHGAQVMPSFDCKVWCMEQGLFNGTSPRRTLITFNGHISECSLTIVNRITAMMDNSWPRGPESFAHDLTKWGPPDDR